VACVARVPSQCYSEKKRAYLFLGTPPKEKENGLNRRKPDFICYAFSL